MTASPERFARVERQETPESWKVVFADCPGIPDMDFREKMVADMIAERFNAAVQARVEAERKEKELAYRLLQNCCLDKGKNERFWQEVEGWLDQKILPECYPPNSTRRFPTDLAVKEAVAAETERCAKIAESQCRRQIVCLACDAAKAIRSRSTSSETGKGERG